MNDAPINLRSAIREIGKVASLGNGQSLDLSGVTGAGGDNQASTADLERAGRCLGDNRAGGR